MQRASAEYRAFIAEVVGQLATGYAGAGDSTKAEALFDESLEIKPDQPTLRQVYAEAALAHGDYERAKKNYVAALGYFQRAAEWNPELPVLDYNRGRPIHST